MAMTMDQQVEEARRNFLVDPMNWERLERWCQLHERAIGRYDGHGFEAWLSWFAKSGNHIKATRASMKRAGAVLIPPVYHTLRMSQRNSKVLILATILGELALLHDIAIPVICRFLSVPFASFPARETLTEISTKHVVSAFEKAEFSKTEGLAELRKACSPINELEESAFIRQMLGTDPEKERQAALAIVALWDDERASKR